MSYKKSKFFLLPSKRKIKYLFLNKKSQITVVFFHGFMSDMIGKKTCCHSEVLRKRKLNFLKFEYSGHGNLRVNLQVEIFLNGQMTQNK
jgi:hypothetical protein